MKAVRYWLEAAAAKALFAVLRALPLGAASAFGGAVAKTFGPFTSVHKVAMRNISRALPELSDEQCRQNISRMWDNLGRVFCEYPHINSAPIQHRIQELVGAEHLRKAIDSGQPIFIVSGHLGNWELPPVVAARSDMQMHLLYRGANNPAVDKLIADIRRPYVLGLHDKGPSAARAIITAMRKQEPVAMLVDQKTNEGIEVPFFGAASMTNDAVAHLVMKYNPLVIPSRCIRLDGCKFRIEVEAPMDFTISGDEDADAAAQRIMQQVHGVLERWIRQDPAQWFWVHKRWPHSKLGGDS